MAQLISDAHSKCYFAFEQLISRLQDPSAYEEQLPLEVVQNEFDKYKVWAGNVGAAHAGKRYEISLDYRLREATFFREQVLRLLKSLEEKIRNVISLERNLQRPTVEQTTDTDSESISSNSQADEDEEPSEDSPWEISSESSAGKGSSAREGTTRPLVGGKLATVELSKVTPPTSLLSQKPTSPVATDEKSRLLGSLQFTISCLYRIPIRKPAPLDRIKHRASFDTSQYQHFDVLYVQDKFPHVEPSVAIRLGKMITRRRQILYYREAHKQSLETARVQPKATPVTQPAPTSLVIRGVPEPIPRDSDSEAMSSQLAFSQTASSHFTLRSKATTVRLGDASPGVTEEAMELANLYAPSLAESKSSMASSYAGDGLRVDVPPRPKNEKGDELELFECPYCLITKHISTHRKWKKHVLEDMQPYVCTYGGCDLFDHFFDSKEAWFTHEAQYHRAKWFCNTDSHIEYESEEAFLIHMSEDHDHNFEDAQFSLLKDVFRRPSQSNEGTCNLCLRFSKRLKSHLARHLQAIALFAIPRVNKTSGSGVAEPKSGSSKSMAKERDRTTAVSSAVSASLLDSEHRPWDQELLLMEPNSALADLDSDIDVGAAAVIPDAVDLSWDDVTDKFSRARERSFRPLNILVIVGDDQRSLERAQQLVEELHCRPVLPPSVGNIDQYNPTEDLVLIDSSYPTDLAVKLAEQFKSRSNLPSDVPQGGVPVIRVTPSGRFYEERGYFDDILPYPLDLALLEDAIGDRCQWAPAPPGWRSEAGPNSNHDGSFRILDVLICCLRPQRKEAWKLSDMLKDFRCRPTVVERVDQPIEQRDQIFETTILSIKFDIIFVDFMYDPHNVENIPRTMLSLADAGLNSMTPIVYLLGETLESNFTDGMIADARVLVEPFSHDILAETLYRLCSWTPPEDRNMQDTDAEDIPLEVENAAADPLPVPEAWLEQYLRTRFRRAPDFILNRLAQHMSALRIQIKNSRLGRESHNTWRELIKASLVIPSGVEKEVLTVCGCSNCMQQWLGGMQEGDNELCPNCGSRVIKSEYIPHLTSPEFPWPFASLPVLHTTSLSDVEIGGRALVALVLSNITPINRSGDPFLTEGQTIIISDWRTNGQLVFRDFSGNKMGHISEEHVRLLKDTETDEHDFVEATTNAEGKPENIDGGLPHLQAHRVSIQNIQFKPTDVFCPYCTSTIILPPRAMSSESIEQPDSTMESIWRHHILEDVKPFICFSQTCRSAYKRWGNYKDWIQHLNQHWSMAKLTSSDTCPLCALGVENLLGHMTEHLLELAGFTVSLDLAMTPNSKVKSTLVDYDSNTAQDRWSAPILEEQAELSDDGDPDLLDIEFRNIITYPPDDGGSEWGFLGGHFKDLNSDPSSHVVYTQAAIRDLKVTDEDHGDAFSGLVRDPYNEVLLTTQIDLLDTLEEEHDSSSFRAFSVLAKLIVTLRARDEPYQTWKVFAAAIPHHIRERFNNLLETIKDDFPDMPRFRRHSRVVVKGMIGIREIIDRKPKEGQWWYRLATNPSDPIVLATSAFSGAWFAEAGLELVDTLVTGDDQTSLANETPLVEVRKPTTGSERIAEEGYDTTEPAEGDRRPVETTAPPGNSTEKLIETQNKDPEAYFLPLLDKQIHILTVALLECILKQDESMLRVNLEKVLNHIKLSEFPYLKWDTFKSVVHSHIFERPTGDEHSQAENDPEFPESTLTRQPVAALQTVLEEFFNNGREECQDLPVFYVGDKVATLMENRVRYPQQVFRIKGRFYDNRTGWLYELIPDFQEGQMIQEANLELLEAIPEYPGPREESAIYLRESFFPYICRKNDLCAKTFETLAERSDHELQGRCQFEADLFDRSFQLGLSIQRRHDPFCRHTDCTESFPTLQARDEHEKDKCPYGLTGGLRAAPAGPSTETIKQADPINEPTTQEDSTNDTRSEPAVDVDPSGVKTKLIQSKFREGDTVLVEFTEEGKDFLPGVKRKRFALTVAKARYDAVKDVWEYRFVEDGGPVYQGEWIRENRLSMKRQGPLWISKAKDTSRTR